ncbi:MAG: NUDIX hydrolase [Planctomycetes bacterium]|nr:NUDIX hydrolase [Planctomycetota bacterium]
MGEPHEVSRQTLCTGKFLQYQVIDWADAQGQVRKWEAVERVRGTNAVLLVPWMRPSNRLVLIRQFRPPTNARVIEFPAGLIEPGEPPENAAVREMREETGYDCVIREVQPDTYNTPGLTSETVYNIVVEIADDAPCRPCPDDGEDIETILVPREGIAAFVKAELAAGSRFDSKVWSYLQGFMAAGGGR